MHMQSDLSFCCCLHMHYHPLCISQLILFFLFRAGTDIVSKAARERVRHYLESLKQHFSGKIFVYASGVAILDILFIEPKTLGIIGFC